jgi:hypothetical protein
MSGFQLGHPLTSDQTAHTRSGLALVSRDASLNAISYSSQLDL